VVLLGLCGIYAIEVDNYRAVHELRAKQMLYQDAASPAAPPGRKANNKTPGAPDTFLKDHGTGNQAAKPGCCI